MTDEKQELYDREWEQFINMGYQGSFTDWLLERMHDIERLAQSRIDKVSDRLKHVENQAGAQQRVQVLERELASLRQQMEFERRGQNAVAPNVGHARPNWGDTAPPPEVYGPEHVRPDPRGGRNTVRQQERVEEIRRNLERLRGYPQDSDSG